MIRARDKLLIWFLRNPEGELSAPTFAERLDVPYEQVYEAIQTMAGDNLLVGRSVTTRRGLRKLYRAAPTLLSMFERYK